MHLITRATVKVFKHILTFKRKGSHFKGIEKRANKRIFLCIHICNHLLKLKISFNILNAPRLDRGINMGNDIIFCSRPQQD